MLLVFWGHSHLPAWPSLSFYSPLAPCLSPSLCNSLKWMGWMILFPIWQMRKQAQKLSNQTTLMAKNRSTSSSLDSFSLNCGTIPLVLYQVYLDIEKNCRTWPTGPSSICERQGREYGKSRQRKEGENLRTKTHGKNSIPFTSSMLKSKHRERND